MTESNRQPEYPKIQRRLARRDAVLKRLIGSVGPCSLRCDADHFGVLARAIISQQISTKAAAAITARLRQALGRRGLSARGILAADDQLLRGAGLSAGKMRYLRDLAAKTANGELGLDGLADLPDDEVIARLLPVQGIGRWTAEMFLIFSLGRLDVLPFDDYGLRFGVQREYGLAELPAKSELFELAEPWRPYRSIGTWYIWASGAAGAAWK